MEYTDELDTFLEQCVASYGKEWQTISDQFREVADELEEDHLREEAYARFSAAGVERR